MERPSTESPSPARAGLFPVLGRTWWIPLAFVALALVLLLATPIVVSRRVNQLRHELSDGSDQARVLVNDLEAAIATQLYIREQSGGPDVGVDSIYADAVAQERRDMRALDSLVRTIGPEAVARFTELRTLAEQWHERTARATSATRRARTPAEGEAPPRQPAVLIAAQRLDVFLERVSAERRAEILRVEERDVLFAMILAPMALGSVAVVFWLGRRVLFFAHEVERDRAALARSIDARAALLRGVTHDVKNPLGAASGYAELLEEGIAGPLTPEQTEMVRRMRHLIGVSVETVSDLLELSQADAGRLRVERTATDVTRLVRDCVEDYRASARERHLALELCLPEEPVEIETDPARVRQILANLLSNAIKYTAEGGRIAVRLAIEPHGSGIAPARRVTAEVRDSGPGVPPSMRERVFEEFFRVPSTKDVASGTGVGLAISRRLARLLDGDITVGEAPEGGAAFTLWLPG